jgi:hypothetical protein
VETVGFVGEICGGGWSLNLVCYSDRVGIWNWIRASCETFSRYITFIIWDGRKVQFWFDGWCVDKALEDLFPELFHISVNTMELVCDYKEVSCPHGGEVVLKIGIPLL